MLKKIIKKYLGYDRKIFQFCLPKGYLPKGYLFQDACKRFLFWNIDTAFRYFPVTARIKKNNHSALSVLDVGSSSLGLSCYFSGMVVGLDIDFYGPKLRNLVPVTATAAQMPFRNDAFDLVVSVDSLEHMPEDIRRSCISEILRVSRRGIILGFPSGRDSQECDLEYNTTFKKRTGKDHPFVMEHIKYGLPDTEELKNYIVDMLNKSGYRYILRIENNYSLILLRFMNKLLVGRNIFVYFLQNKLLIFIFPLLRNITGKNYYRKFIIIDKVS